METWTRVRGAIINGGLEVDCNPIIDWIPVALILKNGNNKSLLAMPRPTTLLEYVYLLRNRHHMLTRHLPGLDPVLQIFQGSLIATHIGESAVEMRRDREENVLSCQADAEKGVTDLLWYNLIYLLRLR